MEDITGKQRMLNAYRGVPVDRPAVAPEFWYYYPARLLGVDMIEFQREVPFHVALKTTFERFGCEGWGVVFADWPNEHVELRSDERWIDADTLETRTTTDTRRGRLCYRQRTSRQEPAWTIERGIKDFAQDLPAWESATFDGDVDSMDVGPAIEAWQEVGDSFLLEGWLGVPFFDAYAGSREGGFQQAVFDFVEHESEMLRLRERYTRLMVRVARVLCEQTPLESFCIGCSWSCNSLIGPDVWRRWDRPVIRAVREEIHRHDRLLHLHFHGRCIETVADFAELGLDCVCPFERPPGGDVTGAEGLRQVARLLDGKVTMNGNVHTVETLIRGGPEDVRREVREVLDAFSGNPRVIVGTGDQVGRETPEENLHAMIDEVKRSSGNWLASADERGGKTGCHENRRKP